jgi:adenosine deaminase
MIELHRHLDVSLRLSTLLELAQERGLEAQSTSLAEFDRKFVLRKPLSDLSSVLAQFTLFQKVLHRPEVLERVAFEAAEDCHLDGIDTIEFRFSPPFVAEHSGLTWQEALESFERGLARARSAFPGFRTGLLCIASRDYGPDEVDRVVEFFIKNRKSFVGLDLAGNEVGFPCRLFKDAFRKALSLGAAITVHAGEATGPDSIWEAIELLGARRIGHGISAIQDPQLIRYLAEKGICLEMCPTSNWITQAVPSFEAHPLPQVLRAGVPVCINTDDPAIFGVKLSEELEICWKTMGMTQAEIRSCFDHARKSTFL